MNDAVHAQWRCYDLIDTWGQWGGVKCAPFGCYEETPTVWAAKPSIPMLPWVGNVDLQSVLDVSILGFSTVFGGSAIPHKKGTRSPSHRRISYFLKTKVDVCPCLPGLLHRCWSAAPATPDRNLVLLVPVGETPILGILRMKGLITWEYA